MNKIISFRSTPIPLSAFFRPIPPILAQTKSDIHDEFNNPDRWPDVRFRVGNNVVHAHKILLARRNDVFNKMFSSGMKESHESEIDVSEATAKLAQYLYQNELDVKTAELAIAVAEEAACKEEPKLAAQLDDLLTKNLNPAALMDHGDVAKALENQLSHLRPILPKLCRAVSVCANGAASRAEYLKEPHKYPVSTFPCSGPMWEKDGFHQPTAVLKNTFFPISVGGQIVHLEASSYKESKTNQTVLNFTALVRHTTGSTVPIDCKGVSNVRLLRTGSETYYIIDHIGESGGDQTTCVGILSGSARTYDIQRPRSASNSWISITEPSSKAETIVTHDRKNLIFIRPGREAEILQLNTDSSAIEHIFVSDQVPGQIFCVEWDPDERCRLVSTDLKGTNREVLAKNLNPLTAVPSSPHITGISYSERKIGLNIIKQNQPILRPDPDISAPHAPWLALYSPLNELYTIDDLGDYDHVFYKTSLTSESPLSPQAIGQKESGLHYCVSSEGIFYNADCWILAYSPFTDTLVRSNYIHDGNSPLAISLVNGALMVSDDHGSTTVWGPNPYAEAKETSLPLDHNLYGRV